MYAVYRCRALAAAVGGSRQPASTRLHSTDDTQNHNNNQHTHNNYPILISLTVFYHRTVLHDNKSPHSTVSVARRIPTHLHPSNPLAANHTTTHSTYTVCCHTRLIASHEQHSTAHSAQPSHPSVVALCTLPISLQVPRYRHCPRCIVAHIESSPLSIASLSSILASYDAHSGSRLIRIAARSSGIPRRCSYQPQLDTTSSIQHPHSPPSVV